MVEKLRPPFLFIIYLTFIGHVVYYEHATVAKTNETQYGDKDNGNKDSDSSKADSDKDNSDKDNSGSQQRHGNQGD